MMPFKEAQHRGNIMVKQNLVQVGFMGQALQAALHFFACWTVRNSGIQVMYEYQLVNVDQVGSFVFVVF